MKYLSLKLAIVQSGEPSYRIAQKIGLRPDALSKIVTGIEEPSQLVRSRLAQYLGRTEAELFTAVEVAGERKEGRHE